MPEKSFSLHMKANKDGTVFEADITCRNYNDMAIDFTYPEELTGFSVNTGEDGLSVNISGIKDILQKDELSNASLLNILTDAINISVYSNHGTFQETENGIEATFQIDNIPVTVLFSEDGYITKIDAPLTGFSAEFQKSG